ncbi:MAG TPA: PspA/IM30 family protein [Armatimonadota bacterium]|jgi:phage shock protein A
MSLLSRLKAALGAGVDQQEALRKEIARLQTDVTNAMAAVEQLRGDLDDQEGRERDLKGQEHQWERDATQCLQRGDETTARECLARAESVKQQREPVSTRVSGLRDNLAKKEEIVSDLRRQLEEYQAEASSLEHRGEFSAAARSALQGADRIGTEGAGRLSSVRREVEDAEVETEARAQVTRSSTPEARVEAQTQTNAVDARLEELKRQLRQE